MNLDVARLREHLGQVERDLVELDEQVAVGEIDDVTGAKLRDGYTRERERILAEIAGTVDVVDGATPPRLVTTRRLVGASFLIVATVLLAWGVTRTVGAGEPAVEGLASDVLSGGGLNLDNVTTDELEAVVAENPDVVPMRLALARRYFNDGDFSKAFAHYMYVLNDLGVQDPGALADVGWMTYLSGRPDLAESFVERSLEIEPNGGVAFWYLAIIRYQGLDDAAGAVAPLESLLAYEDLPTEFRVEAEKMLAEVRAAQ